MTNNEIKKTLTESQFQAADDAVCQLLRSSKRGTPERQAANAVSQEWEAAYRAPQRTFAERETRRELIAATAYRLGLLK